MRATYRLQLTPSFDFDAARAALPYLARLGISHLYLSPITEAPDASAHGYDVSDHSQIRSAFGGEAAFERLREAAQQHGLGLLLDFVPNHAGIGPDNDLWQDVLAWGPHSPHARRFDIDWHPPRTSLRGKVLLPFLGVPYGEALDEDELTVAYEEGTFLARYYDHRFALAPPTYGLILHHLADRNGSDGRCAELAARYDALGPFERDRAHELREELRDVMQDDPPIQLTREERHRLFEQQHWRLAYWKTASDEVNYRRFFNINGLVGLRVEDAEVFDAVHRLLTDLLARPGVDGVRIDHIDGLADPQHYLERLQRAGASRIWVEKICEPEEHLPESWPVEGTTGYGFLNQTMRLLVHPRGAEEIGRAWKAFVPETPSYEETVFRGKRHVIRDLLRADLQRLTHDLLRIAESDYHLRDITFSDIERALTALVASFPRYRTYAPHPHPDTAEVLSGALEAARLRAPEVEEATFAFLQRTLVADLPAELLDESTAWVKRFQQYTAPVVAKGVEDTAFYRYFPLSALCEVGGEPDAFTTSVPAYHERNRQRARLTPAQLLASSTHDHKRGEETRMRIASLADLPARWRRTLGLLDELSAPYRSAGAPAPEHRYLFYQTLLALWAPPFAYGSDRDDLPERLQAYLEKAAREGKMHTSWSRPNERYENALRRFVDETLADERLDLTVGPLAKEIARRGFIRTLSATVLKMTAPGIPDIYQGTEMSDLTLVDPDNRRTVPFDHFQKELAESAAAVTEDPSILGRWLHAGDPRLKQFVIMQLLELRTEEPELFAGSYEALPLEDDRWLAYLRRGGEITLLVCVPRFPDAVAPDAHISIPAISGSTLVDVWSDRPMTLNSDGIDPASAPLPWIAARVQK